MHSFSVKKAPGKKDLRFSRNVNKDIVLCRATSRRAIRQTTEALNRDSISYSKSWIRIPFYRRAQFHGAEEICEISVNRNQYHTARQSIDRMEPVYRRRLALNVV